MKHSTQDQLSQKVFGFFVWTILLLTAIPALAVAPPIFITDSGTVNGLASSTVAPSTVLSINVSATISSIDWEGTEWAIGTTLPGSMSCKNTPDNTGNNSYSESFTVTAPSTPGTYNLYLRINSADDCSGTQSNLLTVAGAVVVKTPIFSETFGTANSETFPIGWSEAGGSDTDIAGNNDGEETTRDATDSDKFARIQGDSNEFICRTIDTSGFNNINLAYFWREDNEADGSNDHGIVEYKNSGGCADGSDGSGWTVIHSHELDGSDNGWSPQETFAFPENIDNSSFLLRFRNNANETNESFRIDDIAVFGDVATGHLIVQKTTYPTGDTTSFPITASGDGTITGGGTGTVTDATDKNYEVTPGTYSVVEDLEDFSRWEEVSNDCANKEVGAGQTVYCTIVNKKSARITVSKTSVGGIGTFAFTGTGVPTDFSVITTEPDEAVSSFFDVFTEIDGTTDISVTETVPTGWDVDQNTCDLHGVLPGDAPTCSFTNTKRGSITVHKDVVSPGEEDVSDDHEFDVTLNESDQQKISENNSYTYDNLIPDIYTIAEIGDPDFDLLRISGDDDESALNGSPVTVLAGQDIDVTITNKQKQGHITIIKHVDNGHGLGESGATEFTISLTGSSPNISPNDFSGNEDGILVALDPGTYTVGESGPLGYAAVYSGACDENGEISVNSNASGAVCTITNKDLPDGEGAIIVTKDLLNDNGGAAESSDFILFINEDEVTGGQAYFFEPDSYTVSEDSESAPSGYAQTDISCTDNGELTTNEDGTIAVEAGHVYRCTITNDDIAPSLTLVKVVDNGEGVGTSTVSDFILTATGSREIGQTNISGSGGVESGPTFSADTYMLSETGPAGYTADEWTCTDFANEGDQITLDLGQSATCTITNTALPGTLHVVKQVTNDSGAENTADDFSFTLKSGDVTSDPYYFIQDGENTLLGTKDVVLNAGTYTVTEVSTEHYSTAYDNCTDIFVPNGGEATCTITNDDTTGTIEGIKYEDQNGNGARDEEDSGLSGWTIYLDANDNGVLDEGEVFMTTGASGAYQFNDLVPDTYHVREVLQDDWTQTLPESGSYTVELAQGEVSDGNHFGNKQNPAPEPTPSPVVQDVCPNLDDIQASVPAPYSLVNGNCIILDGGSGPSQGSFGGSGGNGSVLGTSTTIEEQISALQEQIRELRLRLTIAIMEKIIELQKEIARLRALAH